MWKIIKRLIKQILFIIKDVFIIDDLVRIKKDKRNRIVNNFLRKTHSVKSIQAIIDYGSNNYKPGVSDLDWIIIVDKSTLRIDKSDINELFKSVDKNIFLHRPLIVDKFYFTKLSKMLVYLPHIDYNNYQKIYKVIYRKKDFTFKQEKKIDIDHLLISTVVHMILRKLYLWRMLSGNLNKTLSMRWIIKTINSSIEGIQIIFFLLEKQGVSIKEKTIYESYVKYKRQKDFLVEKIKRGEKLDQRHVFQVYSGIEELRKYLIGELLLKSKSFNITQNIVIQKHSSYVEETAWGRIVYIKDYYQRRKGNLIIKTMEYIGVPLFDIRFLYYFQTIVNYKDIMNKKNSFGLHDSATWQRAECLYGYKDFLEKYGLQDLSDLPLTLLYTDVLVKAPGLISRSMTKVLNVIL